MRHDHGTEPRQAEAASRAANAQLTVLPDTGATEVGGTEPTANAYVTMIISSGRAGAIGVRPNGRTDDFVARATQRRVVGHSNRFTRRLNGRPHALAMRGPWSPASFASTQSPNGRQAVTPIASGEHR